MKSGRWTEEQLAEHQKRNGVVKRALPPTIVVPVVVQPVKPSKYRNTRVTFMRRRFDSKLEARYFKVLWMQSQDQNSRLLWFIRQVPFELEGGVILRVDFMSVLGDKKTMQIDGVEIADAKGVLTRVAINKIKGAEDRYPIKVRIITKADVAGVTL